MPKRLERPEGVVRIKGAKSIIRSITLVRAQHDLIMWEIRTRQKHAEYHMGTTLERGVSLHSISIMPRHGSHDDRVQPFVLTEVFFDTKYYTWSQLVDRTGSNEITVCLFRRY